MPYGRGYQRSMGGTSRRRSSRLTRASNARNTKFTKARNANKPVKRIQRRKYVPKQIKNTASIAVLARQVRTLQRSQVGMYQTKREYITDWPANNQATARLTVTSPLCFCANDFVSQLTTCSNWFLDVAGTNTAVLHWRQDQSAPVPAADEIHDMNQDNDNDIAQLDHYLPISTTVTFEFSLDMKPTDEPVFVRVDVVKPRPGKMLLNSTVHSYMLPGAIQGFTNLAADPLNRNRINTGYYQVLHTKYSVLRNTKDTATAGAIIKRYMKVHIPFPAKVLHTNLSDAASTNETFYSNISMAQQVWVVVSTSLSQGAGAIARGDPCLTINAMRDIRFRDNGGSTAV